MNKKAIKRPKVFISYCWTSEQHEEWVLDLAIRLSEGDGIEVILDKWDLKEGQDKYAFMESMVTSKEIDRVLIICDSGYQNKADNRTGGVGDETQIITPNVYSDTKQEKFIPIIAERDEKGNAFIPAYVKNRIYIELSNEETFEENYEKLIRNIMKAPKYKKPPLGELPLYLFDEEINHFKTKNIIRKMRNALEKNPSRISFLSEEFIEAFVESLKGLQIQNEKIENNQIDDLIKEGIDKSLPLKDDFINYLKVLIEADKVDSDALAELFERIYVFTEIQKGMDHCHPEQFDHFKFILHEIVIYTFTLLFKYKMYSIIADLLDMEYNLSFRGSSENLTAFRFYITSLDKRNKKLKLNRVSYHSELLMQRSNDLRDELIVADVLLFHLLRMRSVNFDWFPITYIHNLFHLNIKFLSKLKSEKFARKNLSVFGVDTIEELKNKIKNFGRPVSFQSTFDSAPIPSQFIKPEDIATKP
ncbi:TIR domain-containing protein [Bacillus nakamurai]|uniref:SEFIR domain-containing protein n=1 Tax=Bacillus nakamurai TaxID=1793963 RepID=A0A150FAP6_9BACI|nr:SEFIR domain-containing protein [Bacillus nakamurai]KXZ22381.1 hypothetical protein AXI58_10345 [Bacillus nakamurai]MED1228396.1 TIR domain-containing protein [Bacillus nakamurai]